MTSKLNDEEYDENCVFNRLFGEKPKTPDTNSANRLGRIFGTAKAPPEIMSETMNETINVADFLPSY